MQDWRDLNLDSEVYIDSDNLEMVICFVSCFTMKGGWMMRPPSSLIKACTHNNDSEAGILDNFEEET